MTGDKGTRMMVGTRLLCLFACTAVFWVGCRTIRDPQAIRVDLKSDRMTYGVGDTFRGTIAFTNTAASRNRISWPDAAWYVVDVYDSRDSLVYEYPAGVAQIITDVDFAPLETKVYALVFRLERADTSTWPQPCPPLPAGAYRLHGKLSVTDGPSADLSFTIE